MFKAAVYLFILMNGFLFSQISSTEEFHSLNTHTGAISAGNETEGMATEKSAYRRSDIIVKSFDPVPFSISAAVLLSAGTYMHIKASENWWKKPERFRLANISGPENIFAGAGHFYSSNLNGHLFSGVYESSGIQALESAWYSSLSSLIYSVYIETENGYHQGRGFNISNMAGSVLGTAFYIGQYYYPVLKNIQPRLSYRSSANLGNGGIFIPEDIYGQKLWLNFRLPELIPEVLPGIWPDFLNVAAGISITQQQNKKIISTFLALDLDAEKLPLYGPFWQFVKNTLNYFHFPMPGIRINPETTAFIFCF